MNELTDENDYDHDYDYDYELQAPCTVPCLGTVSKRYAEVVIVGEQGLVQLP
ncbi:MAG: hypothetical protein WEE89_15640 [Gemmatimonadota bacterium]